MRRGTLAELAAAAEERPPKGEVTLVVAGAPDRAAEQPSLALGRREVQALVDAGMPRSAAAREVASRTGLSRRALFDRAEPEAAPRT